MFWRGRKSREEELDRELQNHLNLAAADAVDSGMTPEEAGYAARRALGNVTYTKEEVRSMWSWSRLEILMQDLRYAWRTLRKSPGFAVTAILTLALGIGASTAVFTLVDSVVLKPLAYRDSGRLVVAWERAKFLGDYKDGPNPRHWDLWRQRATAFQSLTLLQHATTGVMLGTEHPVLVAAVLAVPNLFDVLEVKPLLGRGFVPGDAVKGRDNVAILTFDLWQSMFHGDPKVIGTTVRMSNIPRQVIGVLPVGFHFPNRNALPSFERNQRASGVPEPEIFLPAVITLNDFSWGGEYGNWVAMGRLRPGVTMEQADAQLNAIEAQVIEQMPPESRGDYSSGGLSAWTQPLQEAVVGDSKTALWLLMAAVTGLMLIACLNLANAQLGRALARGREAALRAALGAATGKLMWNALAENLVLAVLGGAGGVLVAAGGLNLFRRSSPVDLPRMAEVHLNPSVLLFSIALTIGASILCGMLPALRLLHTDPQAALQQNNNRTIGGSHSRGVRNALIGLQVFGCTALLLVTGLFSKSLLHLLHQDKGFDTGNVTVAEVRLPALGFDADQERVAFDDAVLVRLRAIPGVESAGLVSAMPLEGETWVDGLNRVDRPDQKAPETNLRWVSPGYFETTRQRIVAGRFFEERDRNLNSIVLSEGEARALWGTENAIGGQVKTAGGFERTTLTVIGVVADSRNASLKSAPVRTAYLHYKNRPPYTTYFFARGPLPAGPLASKMRQAIWSYTSDVTIARVKTMDSQIVDSVASERFQTLVLIGFGVAALLIAMLGIYGVLSYSVSVRRQEIGVRMALGATRGEIYRLTLFEASVPVLLGLAAGLAASLAAGNLIGKLLYGVQPVDAPVILIVSGLFLAAAAVAGFMPARRAASVDPMQALRTE